MNTNLISEKAPGVLAGDLSTSIYDLYDALAAQPDLRPAPVVTSLFERLVSLVVDAPDEMSSAVLDDPRIRSIAGDLRRLSAVGEAALERSWSMHIAGSDRPRQELGRFPYADNYRRLVRLELDALAAAGLPRPRSIAFLGAGPLPLTAFHLAAELDLPVHSVDRDPAAVEAARACARAVGAAELRFELADATTVELGQYDVVVLAALVGETPEHKTAILARLTRAMRPGAVLLARSARGLRTLLYPEVPASALAGFEVVTVVHPTNDVVNSVVVARVPGGGH